MDLKKKILAAIGVVLLGILSSALWDAIKPLLGWLYGAAITLSTLGLQSLRDDLYSDAATYTIARASSRAASHYVVAMLSALIGLLTVLLDKALVSSQRRTYRISVLLILLVSAALVTSFIRLNYIVVLRENYELLDVIVAAQLTDAEHRKLRAEHVQIRTEREYADHVKKLLSIARASGAKIDPNRTFY